MNSFSNSLSGYIFDTKYPVSIPNNNAGASSAILSKYIPTQPIVGITNLKKSTPKNPTIIEAIAPFSVNPFQNNERIIVGQKLAAIPWKPTRTNQNIVLSGVEIATKIATNKAIEAITNVVNLEIPVKSFIWILGLIIFW